MATTKEETVKTLNPNISEEALAALFAGVDIKSLVEEQVAKQLADSKTNQSNPVVLSETRTQAAVEPERYLKHYRCDVDPDIQILRADFDPETGRPGPAFKGQWIKFRRGHFFAKTQAEVDQIEWMRKHPRLDPTDQNRVVGGNPTIYEDDGGNIVRCRECGEPFIAGSNSLVAHMCATHGVCP